MATPQSPLAIPSTIDTTVLNTSLADYQKTLVDNVYNAYTILNVLNQKCKKMINGGVSIVENLIEARQNNGGFYSGADVLETTQDDTLTMVEYKWQNVYEPIMITRDEERQNSGDSHKILDLAATKMQLSEKAMGRRMEEALSKSIAGAGNLKSLADLVGTGDFGSIAGGTDTFWQATSTTSGAFATQGLTDMQTLYYAISSSAQVDTPDLILTTKTVYNKYEQTRLPLERISNGDLSFNAGAKTLTFKGETLTYGDFIDSGVLYMLNTNYLKLYVDSATDMITSPFINPSNQTVKVAYVLWRGNLGTNNRRRMGKLTSIS